MWWQENFIKGKKFELFVKRDHKQNKSSRVIILHEYASSQKQIWKKDANKNFTWTTQLWNKKQNIKRQEITQL